MCNGEREDIEHECSCGHTREVAEREAARRRAELRRMYLPEVPDIETDEQ